MARKRREKDIPGRCGAAAMRPGPTASDTSRGLEVANGDLDSRRGTVGEG